MTGPARSLPRTVARLLLLLGAWGVVVLFTASQLVLTYTATGGPPYWAMTFRSSALQWLPWLVVAPLVLALTRRATLRGGERLRDGAIHLGAMLLAASVVVWLSYPLGAIGGRPIQRAFGVEYLRSVHSIAVVYALLVAGALLADSLRRARERELHVARLERQLAEARFSVLQTQLHPHFLFNTLHGVSSLIHEAPDAAEDMLTALSDLLRTTLGRGTRREVPLAEDIGFLERYLEIHKMRLGDRLQVHLEFAPDAIRLLVPSFVMQPLAENAIRHAIASRRSGGRLDIGARRVDGVLRITVSDDGPGFEHTPTRTGRDGWGIGLENTRERLAQLYGDAHRFAIEERPGGGTVVTIDIPARDAAAAEPPA